MRKGRAVTLSSCLLLASIFACRDFMSPGHSLLWPDSRRLDFSAGPVVTVTPGNMGGWSFINDQTNTACATTTLCALVTGPAGLPSGSGSAELATQASTDGIAIARAGYTGVRLDQLTELSYSTYRQSADAGNNLAIALQLNVDYDLTDADSSYQGRLVYEPYRAAPGGVPQGAWQRWDSRAGKWWGTKATVKRNGVAVANSCVQASPCTWTQILGLFPNLGIHKVYGAVVLKAGSGWSAFRGNVDAISIGVGGVTTTFDFELTGRTVSLLPPDTVSAALLDSLGTVSGAPLSPGQYRKDIVIVEFENGTGLTQRQAAIDSVNGVVIGGKLDADGRDGTYFVRISGGTTAALLNAVGILQRQPGVELAIWWALTPPSEAAFRRPIDTLGGWRDWRIDPATPDASRPNWALEYVRARMAWGCSTGSAATTAGVVDDNIVLTSNLRANVDTSLSEFRDDQAISEPPTSFFSDHGSLTASVMAAVGNDSSGMTGMTGMAWRAHLILQNRTASAVLHNKPFQYNQEYSTLLERHIVSVATRGTDIINLSIETKIAFDSLNPEHVARVLADRGAITRALGKLASASVPRRPLLVIAAGNMGIPARGNGYAWAKARYPNQILVVVVQRRTVRPGLTRTRVNWSMCMPVRCSFGARERTT